MTTQNNTHATDYLKAVANVIESKPSDLSNELHNLAWGYSGDENRFIRQNIINHLTGEKNIIAKCGIRALAEHTEAYIARLKAEATAPAPEPTNEPDGIAGIDYPLPGEVTVSEAIEAPATTADELKAAVGLEVIRKQCKRKGVVTAIENLKVTVTLEDGSVRRPCMSRFKKLYNAA
jgi:hypothetical protein